MQRNLTIIFLIILLNLIGLRTAHSANPLVVIEGVGLGVDLLKKGADKVKGAFTKDKDKDKNNGYLKSHEFQFRHYETAEIFFGESAYRFEDARAEAKNKCELKNPQSKQACLEYSYTKIGSKGPLENISYWAQSKKRYLEEYGENGDFTKITEWTETSNIKDIKLDKNYLISLPTNRRFYLYDEPEMFFNELKNIKKLDNLNLNSKVFIKSNTSSKYKEHWNKKYPKSFSSNKAWAQSSDGAWAWKTGYSAIDAAKKALDYCSTFITNGPKQCVLIKVNDKILNYEEQNYYSEKIYNQPTLIATIIKNQSQNLYANNSKSSLNYNWYALAKHPKLNNEFIATKVSNEQDAKTIALDKCYEFVKKVIKEDDTSRILYEECYVDKTVDENKNQLLAKELLAKQNNQKIAKKVSNINEDNESSFKGTGSTWMLKPKYEDNSRFNDKLCKKAEAKAIEHALFERPKEQRIFDKKKIIKRKISNYSYNKNYRKCIVTVELIKNKNKISTNTEIVKKQKPTVIKKEEFQPKDNDQDNKAPVIKIAKSFKVNEPSYVIEGEVTDQSDRIFIEVEGKTIQAKNGKFKINRFSPIDEEFNIVAIDQWGNRSEPQLVQIIVDTSVSLVADKVEPLNPTKIRSKPDRNKIALIIGIEKYEQTPNASFANLDAKYFYEYARNSFGVSKKNIKILVDEDANLIQSLGTLNKWLPGKVKSNQTEVIIFFAGHGLASNNGEELFLLPQDSDPDLLERTALSRNELFESLLKLNPKSVTMFFDTCFSGISRDERTLLASARPIRITANEQDDVPNNFTIFSASQLDQISSGLKEAKHGIFSYYLMKGLEGDADLNKDRKITNGELLAYMDDNVSQKASELGRQQNPTLTGNPDQILARY